MNNGDSDGDGMEETEQVPEQNGVSEENGTTDSSEDSDEKENKRAPRLFSFQVVNSYGTMDVDSLQDDGQPLKFHSKYGESVVYIMFGYDGHFACWVVIQIATVKHLIWGPSNPKTYMFLVSSCSCRCPIHWSQVLSPEWRCSWSSADRRCSNYIWVINSYIAYYVASYIGGVMACTVSSRYFAVTSLQITHEGHS